jgi:hypothetical protein
MVRLRVRIRFSKQGDLRLIGHRDLMRCMERLFRRANLSLSFSEGFHPKPRMTFPLALAVGIEGLDEVMEFELASPGKGDSPHLPERPGGCFAQMGTVPFSGVLTGDELLQRIAPHAPAGLAFLAAEVLPEGCKKASVRSVCYEATIPASDLSQGNLAERIERLLSASSCMVERTHGRAAIDIRPLIGELSLSEGVLRMRLSVDSHGSVGPREVLAALGLPDIEQHGSHLRRTAVEICT